ncbi:MAG: hypothetical protein JSV42_18150 [Chloroflexota bacterium]|nr:MAG: hypothetical protein JSV42_18150 [Chloroflexota bacterium]
MENASKFPLKIKDGAGEEAVCIGDEIRGDDRVATQSPDDGLIPGGSLFPGNVWKRGIGYRSP